MKASLEEIIIGTSLSHYQAFEIAKKAYIDSSMFSDPMLGKLWDDMERCYKEGKYDKDCDTFDFLEICGEDIEKALRLVFCVCDGDFVILKHDYNWECYWFGKGNWTDLNFSDYVKSFVNQYVARCKMMRQSSR